MFYSISYPTIDPLMGVLIGLKASPPPCWAGCHAPRRINLPRQAVMGSAKMVLETGEHPGTLKDMVCSPGGTTIEAVRVLEEKGFRAAVIEAMTKCMEKSEKLSKS